MGFSAAGEGSASEVADAARSMLAARRAERVRPLREPLELRPWKPDSARRGTSRLWGRGPERGATLEPCAAMHPTWLPCLTLDFLHQANNRDPTPLDAAAAQSCRKSISEGSSEAQLMFVADL